MRSSPCARVVTATSSVFLAHPTSRSARNDGSRGLRALQHPGTGRMELIPCHSRAMGLGLLPCFLVVETFASVRQSRCPASGKVYWSQRAPSEESGERLEATASVTVALGMRSSEPVRAFGLSQKRRWAIFWQPHLGAEQQSKHSKARQLPRQPTNDPKGFPHLAKSIRSIWQTCSNNGAFCVFLKLP